MSQIVVPLRLSKLLSETFFFPQNVLGLNITKINFNWCQGLKVWPSTGYLNQFNFTSLL